MRIYFILASLLINSFFAFAQEVKQDSIEVAHHQDTIVVKKKGISQKYLLNTPQLSLKTYLNNLKEDNYHPEIAAKVLNIKNASTEEKIDAAVKLKKIIDGRGILININYVPAEADYIDSVLRENIYILSDDLSDIYLEKVGGKWLFSEETVKLIPVMYKKIAPFSLSFIEDALPGFMKVKFFSVEIWKYFGLLAYLFLMFFIYKLLSIIMGFILKKVIIKIGKENLGKQFLFPVSNPISILFVILILIGIIPTLELPVKFNLFLLSALKVFIPITAVFIAFRAINLISYFFEKLAAKTKSSLDDHLVPFARKGLKGLVLLLGAFYILDVLNVNITPLLAGVSIGGLAFALAAQDTVKNIFGSLTIFVDQSFQVGDWIRFGDGEGTVEEIGLRSTRIRTFDDSLITIPNGKISDEVINNIGKRNYRRYNTMLGVLYSTPMPLLEAFKSGIKRIIKEHPNTVKDDSIQAAFYTYNSSSLDIRVNMFFDVPDFKAELKAREEINSRIYELAGYLGIGFAFPTHLIFIEKEADYSEKLNSDLNKKIDVFFKVDEKN